MKYYDEQTRSWQELTDWSDVPDDVNMLMDMSEAFMRQYDGTYQLVPRSYLPPEPGPLEILDELIRKSEWLLAKFRG